MIAATPPASTGAGPCLARFLAPLLGFFGLLVLAVTAPAADRENRFADLHDLPSDASYEARILAVRTLGERYPGLVHGLGFEYRELGLWAGILIQTKWQKESGRDDLDIWFHVNRNLTLLPLVYHHEYAPDPDLPYEASPYVVNHPTRGGAQAPVTHVDTCRAWKEYFKAHDAAAAADREGGFLGRFGNGFRKWFVVTRKLWRAHTTAMKQAIWEYLPEFRSSPHPREELRFWAGWIRFVFFSEKLAPPTTDILGKPILNAAMPECSPLGLEPCTLRRQPFLRRAFLRLLTRGDIDPGRYFEIMGELDPSGSWVAGRVAGTVAVAGDLDLETRMEHRRALLRLLEAVRTGPSPCDPRLDRFLSGLLGPSPAP